MYWLSSLFKLRSILNHFYCFSFVLFSTKAVTIFTLYLNMHRHKNGWIHVRQQVVFMTYSSEFLFLFFFRLRKTTELFLLYSVWHTRIIYRLTDVNKLFWWLSSMGISSSIQWHARNTITLYRRNMYESNTKPIRK